MKFLYSIPFIGPDLERYHKRQRFVSAFITVKEASERGAAAFNEMNRNSGRIAYAMAVVSLAIKET